MKPHLLKKCDHPKYIVYICDYCEYLSIYNKETRSIDKICKGNEGVVHRLYNTEHGADTSLKTIKIGTLNIVNKCELKNQGLGSCEYTCGFCIEN